MEGGALIRWHALLEHLNYYQLLEVSPASSFDEVQLAFQRFALDFHPDQHRARTEEEREIVLDVFRRGSEAYRVLQDPTLRARYDQGLHEGRMRLMNSMTPHAPPANSMAPAPMPSIPPVSPSLAPRRLEDQVRTPSIRPFVRRAEELAEKGAWAEAHLQVRLALSREPENSALQDFEKRMQAARKG